VEKKQALSFKKWIAVFAVTIVVLGALICGFNVLVDPFGIFGDVLFDWYSYNMTQNPRAAKIAYLDKNYSKYDSYIIGCSKTGSYSTEALNRYYDGASFYNMLMYGGDMYDIELTAKYILENYDVKNIVVNMGLEETVRYDTQADEMKSNLHGKVDGSSLPAYYGKYIFANPSYAVSKITAWYNDGYLVNENDVFLPESGVYDKSVRDVERVGSLNEFLAAYPSFKTILKKEKLDAKDKCLGSVKRIKEMCDEKGVSFLMIISPIFHTEMDIYDKGQLEEFLTGLSQITDYWNFSGYNSVSYEPRYFYDPYHFRNPVGDMVLAKIFDDNSIYMPVDLGRYVTADNVAEHLSFYFGNHSKILVGDGSSGEADPAGGVKESVTETAAYSKNVPVLMYHHLDNAVANDAIMTPERFEEHMTALKNDGYSAISLVQLLDYVDKGVELPEKPVLITFDDGYASNYELAYPILEKYNMKAVINIIGVTAGKDTYKDTGAAIIPHFTYDEAREMIESGVIEIQSHSYDMHNSEVLDEDYRQGVYKKAGETEEEYIEAFCADFRRAEKEILDNTGSSVIAYAYPNGFYTTLSEVLLSRMGVRITMTVEEGMNTAIKGLPQSLRAMKRYRMHERITGEALVERLQKDGQ
jgi:peptidoglycan/xylan/chitin deacetylase (PgdA/CDA1 family)